LTSSASSQRVSSCASAEDSRLRLAGSGSGGPAPRGLSVFVRFRMGAQHRGLFVRDPASAAAYLLPADASTLSDAEFVGYVHRVIVDSAFSSSFRSQLIGNLMKYKGVNLKVPQASASAAAAAGAPPAEEDEVWRPIPYWNWLRPSNVHVHIIREHELPPASLSQIWVQPLATSLLGDELGRDVLHRQSLDALLLSSLILICSFGLVMFLRWQKSKANASTAGAANQGRPRRDRR
jgi:hypothetical protein